MKTVDSEMSQQVTGDKAMPEPRDAQEIKVPAAKPDALGPTT